MWKRCTGNRHLWKTFHRTRSKNFWYCTIVVSSPSMNKSRSSMITNIWSGDINCFLSNKYLRFIKDHNNWCQNTWLSHVRILSAVANLRTWTKRMGIEARSKCSTACDAAIVSVANVARSRSSRTRSLATNVRSRFARIATTGQTWTIIITTLMVKHNELTNLTV